MSSVDQIPIAFLTGCQLKSGGPKMTVIDVQKFSGQYNLLCSWNPNEEIQCGRITLDRSWLGLHMLKPWKE